MTKFAVHYWIQGCNGVEHVTAETPDDAKKAFKKKYPKAEIIKTKLVRAS